MFSRGAILMALADGPPVEFKSTATTASGTTVTKPADLEVGMVVLVFAMNETGGATLTTASGSAWTRSEATLGGQTVIFFWKVLNATDVANAWNLSASAAAGAVAVAYIGHGATTVTIKDSDAISGTTNFSLTSTGFAKAAGHYGVIALLYDSLTTATAGLSPSGFVERVRTNATGRLVVIADQLIGYVDATDLTWSNLNTAAPADNAALALLLEVTGP
jgi:hypothetical protein